MGGPRNVPKTIYGTLALVPRHGCLCNSSIHFLVSTLTTVPIPDNVHNTNICIIIINECNVGAYTGQGV